MKPNMTALRAAVFVQETAALFFCLPAEGKEMFYINSKRRYNNKLQSTEI